MALRIPTGSQMASAQPSTDGVTESGVVVELLADGVRVETQRRSGCASCSAKGGCGVGLMQQALSRHRHAVTARCRLPVRVGDQVELTLPQTALVQASLWMYFVPLLGMLLGAITGQQLADLEAAVPADAAALLGGALGFVAAIRLVSARQGRQLRSGRYAPEVTRVLPAMGLDATPGLDLRP